MATAGKVDQLVACDAGWRIDDGAFNVRGHGNALIIGYGDTQDSR